MMPTWFFTEAPRFQMRAVRRSTQRSLRPLPAATVGLNQIEVVRHPGDDHSADLLPLVVAPHQVQGLPGHDANEEQEDHAGQEKYGWQRAPADLRRSGGGDRGPAAL